MRAARYYGREDIRVEDVAEAPVGPGDVKLKVRYGGICGSDLHEYYRGPFFTRIVPHPLTGVKNPVVIGHELSGEVIDRGEGVTDVRLGDLVAVIPVETCGACEACRSGGRCTLAAIHGYTRESGGLSEYTVVKESMALVLPPEIDPLAGALVEPMHVGLRAANRAGAVAGQTVVVHGAGAIGLAVLFALRAKGIETIASEPSASRREVLRGLGFRHVLDPGQEDIAAAVLDLTAGIGAHAAVDAAGVPAVMDVALRSTANDGTIVLVAVPMQPIVLDAELFRRSGVNYTSANGGRVPVRDTFNETVELMLGGAYPTDGWVETIRLDDVVKEGFGPLHRAEKMKVLVEFPTQV